MSTKRRSTRAKPTLAAAFDPAMAATVKAQAQQIWLAGMGAFSRAQGQSTKVFDTLMSEGIKLQRKTQSMAEDRISDVAGKMTAVADGVSSKAGAQWDRLETIFEERVAKALNKMGVPSRADVDTLIARIDALSAQMGRSATTSGKRSAPKKAVRVAAKPAAQGVAKRLPKRLPKGAAKRTAKRAR
jgi:poly(hydroxyalkanoate) granule-associated protein